jgi:hypothetical protein
LVAPPFVAPPLIGVVVLLRLPPVLGLVLVLAPPLLRPEVVAVVARVPPAPPWTDALLELAVDVPPTLGVVSNALLPPIGAVDFAVAPPEAVALDELPARADCGFVVAPP